MFEGRKMSRGTAFVKVTFSLRKTKMDLCAVIYRKWLEAGRRERLLFFLEIISYTKNRPFKDIFSTHQDIPC